MKLNRQLSLIALIMIALSSFSMVAMDPNFIAFMITGGKTPIKPIRAYMINENHNLIFAVHPDSITFWDTHGNQLHEMATEGVAPTQIERVLHMLAHNLQYPEHAVRIFHPVIPSAENICPVCLLNETEVNADNHAETPCCHKFICLRDLATLKTLGQACPLCRSRVGWE